MIVTQQMLLRKIEELSLFGDGKPIDINLLANTFKCPAADIIILLYELEKWHIVRVNIEDQQSKYTNAYKAKREVMLLK